MELHEAVNVWLNYKDSDKYNEEKAMEVVKARITIREALRRGCVIIDTETFNSDSATECFTAIHNAKEDRH